MEALSVVVGAVAGFVFSQANKHFERKLEKSKALNKALSELLEIRHRCKTAFYILHRLTTEVTLPPETYDYVLAELPEGFLWDHAISVRYNEAIDLLASYAPVLSYALRSKDLAGLFSGGSFIRFGETQASFEFAKEVLGHLSDRLMPELESSIELIAELAGRKQKENISALLSQTHEPPEAAKEFGDFLLTRLNNIPEISNYTSS